MRGYNRARFVNAQGEREEVVLFDPQDDSSDHMLAIPSHPELFLDLKEAIAENFTRVERKVIFNTLVKNQPMTIATRGLRKHPARWWREWLRTKALPKLRKLLADYQEDGRVVL
jgi:hypothetical protein